MPTIKDVAKETGLSVGTVSRVLNNRGYISEATRQNVDRAMKKLNYQPNEIARSLCKSTSSIVGVIIPTLTNPYFAEMTEHLEKALASNGYQIMLFTSGNSRNREKDIVMECRKNRVAGIIVCSGVFSSVKLAELDIPVIALERLKDNTSFSIECDNYEGGRIATKHLIDKGSRKLVHISGVTGKVMPADKRKEGFMDVCQEEGVDGISYNTTEEEYLNLDYLSLLDRIFNENPDVDGVFASSDAIGAEVIQCIIKKGKRVPEDVKVIGFDGTFVSKLTSPTLSTISQPISEMAEIAVSTLLRFSKKKPTTTNIKVGVELIERDSTR